MTDKSIPVKTRINKLTEFGSTGKIGTPSSLNKRFILNKQISNLEHTSQRVTNEIDLNKAFAVTSPLKKSRPSPSLKQKSKSSTALNACYTPSSLFRSANSIPTPIYKTPTSLHKTSRTPAHSSSVKKIKSRVCENTPDCFSKVKLFDSDKKLIQDHDELKVLVKDGEASNLTVAVRIRPLNTQECLNSSVTNCVSVIGDEVIIKGNLSSDGTFGVNHSFLYDHVFWSCNSDDASYADQKCVFNGTGLPLIEKAFEGYNACLFAYGQTGSGKSYSMMGVEAEDSEDSMAESSIDAGIIPRFCKELFRRIESNTPNFEAQITISYFEIYNEKIHDLLSVTSSSKIIDNNIVNNAAKNALKVREHPVWGPYIVDLSAHPVDCYSALRNWLTLGNSQRATAATGMNDKSSRSHSIFNINLNLTVVEENEDKTHVKQTKRSKISLVDLAGSERISHKTSSGERVREGVSINKSLLTLGKVIAALADFKKGHVFVPYRESVLTWLLRESLGGNSKTVMLATISPASIHMDETLATLRYACQARTIVNRVKINEDPHDKVIRELRAEVERLHALRQEYERQKRYSNNENLPPRKIIIETSSDDSEVEALRQQLVETERELAKAQKSWMDRVKEADDLRKSEIRMLKRKGLAMELSIEQKQPCLINLAADPMLSGTLLYLLPPGKVLIGRSRPTAFSQPDIVLDGPKVAFQHCSIENKNGRLFIMPENEEFETFLNGELIEEIKQVYHGDRLVIGGSHYFRISNPNCVNKKNENNIIVDYQLAHQEILQKQEEQLRKELEDEKRAALDQIEMERLANEKNYMERLELLELEKVKFKCTRELVETEQKVVEEPNFKYSPYKSTLLDDIKRIMERPTNSYLNQLELKVGEATIRCKNIGVKYEFKQMQVLDDMGIFRAVVKIVDKENRRIAEWPPARLDVWLELARNTSDLNRDNIFDLVDIYWTRLAAEAGSSEKNEQDENPTELKNSTRISLNTNAVKDALFIEPCSEKVQNIFVDTSNNTNKDVAANSPLCGIEKVRKTLTFDEEEINLYQIKSNDEGDKKFSSVAFIHLMNIQKSTLKLKKLCHQIESNENYNKEISFDYFKRSIDKMENIIFDLKATLTEQKLATSPTKNPRAVRFFLD